MTTLEQLTGTYTIDPTHSRIGFVTRHAMVTKVRGSFNDFEGTATTGADLADTSIDLTAQVASIDTRNADRDQHLKAGDFFGADEFPTLTFRSTQVTATDADTLRVTGDLTIKGTTRPVTVDFDFEGAATDPFGNERIGFEGKTVVNRKDFGVSLDIPMEGGGAVIGDKITITLEIEALQA